MVASVQSVQVRLPASDPAPRGLHLSLQRCTVADTWRWMRPDLVIRILPMLVVPTAWATWRTGGLGWLVWPAGVDATQLAIWIGWGLAHGLVVTATCLAYRVRRLKVRALFSPGALVADSAYYHLVNAPVEELLFRGWLQPLAGEALRNPWLGMGAAALVYGLYHRLGHWSWELVVLVTVGGLYFGTLQIVYGSLLVPIVAHGMATSALLSWGPHLLVRCVPHWACAWDEGVSIP